MTVLSRYRQSMVGGVKVNWRAKFLPAFWLVARTHTYKDDDFSIDSVPVHLGPFFISSLILITAFFFRILKNLPNFDIRFKYVLINVHFSLIHSSALINIVNCCGKKISEINKYVIFSLYI